MRCILDIRLNTWILTSELSQMFRGSKRLVKQKNLAPTNLVNIATSVTKLNVKLHGLNFTLDFLLLPRYLCSKS